MSANLAMVIAAAVMYFFYNGYLFSFAQNILGVTAARWKTHGAAFALNFCMFIVMSLAACPLVINWTIIGAVYVAEVKLILHAPWRSGILVALLGALIGLATNMLMRAGFAFAADVPLSAIDTGTGKLRLAPITLGFLLAAVAVRVSDVPSNRRILSVIFSEQRVADYLVVTLMLCYLYLCTNFLLYQDSLNPPISKFWSIKNVMFVSVGVTMVIWFSYRIASTFAQMKRRNALRREVEEREKANESMLKMAEHDPLTGCYNRLYAEGRLGELLAGRKACQVVFVDVDNLKQVNDRFGHDAGDAYIASVADALDQARGSADDFVARFGGDEFLVVLARPVAVNELEERMRMAADALRESAREKQLAFLPTASWGMAASAPGDDAAALVARADAVMYKNKRRKGSLHEIA